jgi:Protein of unknown function (DUF4242)
MQKIKMFIDTHDKRNGTFPERIEKEAFGDVYRLYAAACEQEGVVIVTTMLNAEDGKMYCVNLAPDAEAIRRAHDRIGLKFDSISEVTTASPGDIYFHWE